MLALDLPVPRRDGVALVAHALAFDAYGNVFLDVHGDELPNNVTVGGRPAVRGRTFADVPVGSLLLYEDSSGTLALAINQGSARDELGLDPGDEVRLA